MKSNIRIYHISTSDDQFYCISNFLTINLTGGDSSVHSRDDFIDSGDDDDDDDDDMSTYGGHMVSGNGAKLEITRSFYDSISIIERSFYSPKLG